VIWYFEKYNHLHPQEGYYTLPGGKLTKLDVILPEEIHPTGVDLSICY